jgi:hypothetical protein
MRSAAALGSIDTRLPAKANKIAAVFKRVLGGWCGSNSIEHAAMVSQRWTDMKAYHLA